MLRIAACQMRTCADRASSLDRASALIASAAKGGARLVILPESWTGLYGVQHFANNAENWLAKGSGTALMCGLARQYNLFICGGVIERAEDTNLLYNTIAAFGPDGSEVARYRKIHLSCVSIGNDQTSEGTILRPGTELSYFEIDSSWRIGLACCFDLRFADLATALTRTHSCDVILYPSAWLKSSGELGHWETLLKARALDGQCYTVGVSNPVDESTTPVSFGRSCCVDPLGQIIAVCEDDAANEVVFADLSEKDLISTRERIPLKRVREARQERNVLL